MLNEPSLIKLLVAEPEKVVCVKLVMLDKAILKRAFDEPSQAKSRARTLCFLMALRVN